MSDNKWSAADIFKARILDAWERYPEDEDASILLVDIGEILERDGDMETGDEWVLTQNASALLDRARKEGVL